MDWRVTTVARSSLVTPLRINLVVRRFGVGRLVFEFHVQHPLDCVQCGVDGGEVQHVVSAGACWPTSERRCVAAASLRRVREEAVDDGRHLLGAIKQNQVPCLFNDLKC